MKFTPANIENLASCFDKMQRYFAFKYEVKKDKIAFVIKGHGIHVMVDGNMKESLTVQALRNLAINDETGELINVTTPRKYSYTDNFELR